MTLALDGKKAIVNEIAPYAAKAHSAVAAEYCGLTVFELTQLRTVARKTGVYLRVIKNTLAKRAVAGTQFECMQERMVGPLIFAFSMEDPGAAGRLIDDFAKTNKKLIAKIVSIDGQAYDGSELARLASLPTRDQGISLIMALMLAPVEKLVRTLLALKEHKDSSVAE